MKKTVAVCVPGHDQVSLFWAYDLARMMSWSAANIEDLRLLQFFSCGTLLQASREKLIDAALYNEADYVLFLDSDMRFPKDTLKRLLDHDVPCVGVNYCQRNEPFWPVARTKLTDALEDRLFASATVNGLISVAATGFGVMLIKTEYLKKMEKPRFAVGWSKAGQAYVTEDMYFCMRMGEIGAEILIDNDLSQQVAHTGNFEFSLEHATQYVFNQAEKAKQEAAI